jgi:hypothetical protein
MDMQHHGCDGMACFIGTHSDGGMTGHQRSSAFPPPTTSNNERKLASDRAPVGVR